MKSLEQCFPDNEEFSESEAVIEAQRCLNCFLAPCINACPTKINIPQFINRIATKNKLGAAKSILEANILGHSCALSCPTEVLCEGACVYHSLNESPIKIGKLQAFAVAESYKARHRFFKPGPPSNKRVALIGAGPASLACAHELRRHGHEAIIYEKSALPGGLNTYGIAPYKMKSSISLREIEEILSLGVQIKFGVELGQNIAIEKLIEENDAIFFGMGLGNDRYLDLPGIDHPRIMGAVSFIAKMKAMPASEMSWLKELKKVLVIGGGNTAIDACREIKMLGIPEVKLCYRKDEAQMSAYKHERNHAALAGVSFVFNSIPEAFAASANAPLQVTLKVSNKILVEHCDLVLLAIGQGSLESYISSVPGLKFENGRLLTDSNGKTGHPKIYAGGDIANGGKEVVNAVAEGKAAALAINRDFYHG